MLSIAAMKTAARALATLLAFGLCACSDEPQLVIVIEHPTLIEVSPSEFLGNVPCLEAEGAMRRYVATVFDVTTDEDAGTAEDFALPSSGPTNCSQPVGFAFVVGGHRYAAEVDGYDRVDIEPLAPGSRVMIDPETALTVSPRWTTSCGREAGESAYAVRETTRDVSHCDPLVDHAPGTSEALVLVDLEPALGALECGAEPGQVDHFQVSDGGTVLASVTCGESAQLSGLSANVIHELSLLAFEAGATAPSFGTTCEVSPVSGVTVEAVCSPLESQGALDIDLPAALRALSLACDSSLRELSVVGPADLAARRVTPPACSRTLRVSELPPGAAALAITTVLADGTAGPSATCSGVVLPGLIQSATCSADAGD